MPKHTSEQIASVASSLMPNFIPKDETIKSLSFAFTLDGINYEVLFEKDHRDAWHLISQNHPDKAV
ncbi:hypothetical protein GZH53_07925 [Flavihumibacter sp. R14]|nr:hypothetical protein [Flavihumibacter soli]